jgi:hypothetical protein
LFAGGVLFVVVVFVVGIAGQMGGYVIVGFVRQMCVFVNVLVPRIVVSPMRVVFTRRFGDNHWISFPWMYLVIITIIG